MWFDYGLGIVIGCIVIIEDDVSIWYGVILGLNFVSMGDRCYFLIGWGVVLGGYLIILGGIDIGVNVVVVVGVIVIKLVLEGKIVYGFKVIICDCKFNSFNGFV